MSSTSSSNDPSRGGRSAKTRQCLDAPIGASLQIGRSNNNSFAFFNPPPRSRSQRYHNHKVQAPARLGALDTADLAVRSLTLAPKSQPACSSLCELGPGRAHLGTG